jgi:hypothetical protein
MMSAIVSALADIGDIPSASAAMAPNNARRLNITILPVARGLG